MGLAGESGGVRTVPEAEGSPPGKQSIPITLFVGSRESGGGGVVSIVVRLALWPLKPAGAVRLVLAEANPHFSVRLFGADTLWEEGAHACSCR